MNLFLMVGLYPQCPGEGEQRRGLDTSAPYDLIASNSTTVLYQFHYDLLVLADAALPLG